MAELPIDPFVDPASSSENKIKVESSIELEDKSLLESSSSSFQSADTQLRLQESLAPAPQFPIKPPSSGSSIMEKLDSSAFKLVTEKLDKDNFTSWRWGIITALGYKDLDDYILADHTAVMKSSPDYAQKKKQVTNFIRMHLSNTNLERFVPKITDYEPKDLWDNIVKHFAAKTVENTANALDKLFDVQFVEGEMDKSIDSFRHCFRSLTEVSTKFDKASLEAVSVIFALKRLPPSFSVFRHLQFAGFKGDDDIGFEKFLEDLEIEVRRQREAQQQLLASAARAMVVAPSHNDSGPGSSTKKKGRRFCSNGKHNPDAAHPESECFQLHPDKEVAFHKAAAEKANARIPPRASLSVASIKLDSIILDSGASGHFLKDRQYFHSLSSSNSTVYGANGAAIPIVGFGPATLPTLAGPVHLSLAYYTPQLSNSLVSLTHYLRRGFSIIPVNGGNRFECRKGAEVIFVGTTREDVLLIDMNHLRANAVNLPDPIDLHRALGHPSLPYLKKAYPDLKISSLDCGDCDRAKMHKQPFGGSFPPLKQPLDCIHMDLCGPITPASRGGNRFFLKILDGFSKYRFIYPMRCKSDAFHHFKLFINLAETHTGHRLKSVVSDNGGEFCNHLFDNYFREHGVQHLTSAPYTPQQNPFAERGNRTTIEKTRALLSTSGLPLHWWGEAVELSVYLENRSPDSSIGFKSPYELWFGNKPDLSCLVPFGCRAVLLDDRNWDPRKFSPSGVEAIFLNYDGHHHSYKVWVPESNNIVISHHVRFFPQSFPLKAIDDKEPPEVDWFDHTAVSEDLLSTPPPQTTGPEPVFSDQETVVRSPTPQLEPEPQVDSTVPPPAPKGYEYVSDFGRAPKDISSAIDVSNIIEGGRRHRAMVIIGEPSSLKDPATYGEILGRVDENEWLMAVEVELGNMRRHEVWVVAPMAPGTRRLDTTWVFKRKFDADGRLLKYKARLCVRGFRQVEGIDYNSTFAPTGRLATLRILLGLATVEDFEIHQMDVKCAFLNGVPDEDLFIKVPDGLGIELPPGHGLKLQRSLYGLKQSPRCWYRALHDFFTSINFKPTVVDSCLFCHQDSTQPCFVYVHVDDLVIVGPDVSFFKNKITRHFEMEDLGECKWVLGMRVTRDRSTRTLTLSQDRYAKEILEEFDLTDCKSISNPLPADVFTHPVKDEPPTPGFNYRRGVGLLQYLVQCTRPDLAFAVSYLSQFLNKPSKTHQEQLLHTMRYVQHTRNYGLTLGDVGGDPHKLVAYADASYASASQASTFAGSAVFLNGLVGWRCQKQDDDAPALSTTEAEYRSCSETGQDIRWAEQLLDEIHPLLKIPSQNVLLYCDNKGALALLEDTVYQHRTRHINVRHHWLRFHIHQANNFTLKYIKTGDNLADFLTKPLPPRTVRAACGKVALTDLGL